MRFEELASKAGKAAASLGRRAERPSFSRVLEDRRRQNLIAGWSVAGIVVFAVLGGGLVWLTPSRQVPPAVTPITTTTAVSVSSEPDQISTTTTTEEAGEGATLTFTYTQRDAFYTEGSATEFDLLSSSRGRVTFGAVLLPEEGEQLAHLQLKPDIYTLRSWQRPCPGSCDGPLEPPTDICATWFTVETNTDIKASVVVRPGQGCTFDVEGVEATPILPGDYAALSVTFPMSDSSTAQTPRTTEPPLPGDPSAPALTTIPPPETVPAVLYGTGIVGVHEGCMTFRRTDGETVGLIWFHGDVTIDDTGTIRSRSRPSETKTFRSGDMITIGGMGEFSYPGEEFSSPEDFVNPPGPSCPVDEFAIVYEVVLAPSR